MHRFVLALPAVLVVAACAAGPYGAATAGSTTTTTVTATAPGVTATSAPSVDADLAARLAALACQQYAYAGTVSAAEGSAPLDDAASTVTSAAVVDPRWTDLAGAVAFVAALPLTDVAPEDQDRATDQIAVVEARCRDAGVTVS